MFIVSPRLGLCNQLQSIVKGFLLANKYNRTIYVDGFQIDLDSNVLCDINEILDIDSMNNLYLNHNLNIKIIKSINPQIIAELETHKLKEINYNNLQNISYINNIIENNMDKDIIYIGNPVMLSIFESFDLNYHDYNNLYYFLLNNLIYQNKFHHIKDNIKNTLQLTNYTCFHLRIEDDAIHHFSYCHNLSVDEYNKILLDFYKNKISIEDKKMYICSGILEKQSNINYNLYNELCNENNKICDKKNIEIDSYIKNNRELIAIVDLLIAYDSDYFVGSWISSFSQCIKSYLLNKGKNTDLFHL